MDERERLKDLFLFILQESGESRALTRTKMAKLLWYSDFGAYRDLGSPLTGWPYIKEQYGPMPKEMLLIERDLESEGSINLLPESGATRYELLRPAPQKTFGRDQVAHIRHVLFLYRNAWASYLSTRAHEESVGWQVAARREEIPYQTELLSSEPLTEAETHRAQQLAARYGWL